MSSHPTNPNKGALQELTQKIHKHCPELLELSFGCRVGFKYHPSFSYVTEDPLPGRDVMTQDGIFEQKQLEILGHPITLEHVLKAMAGTPTTYLVDEGGGFWRIEPNCECEAITGAAFWLLTKPLTSQSPELIEWLNQIIV
jgi:hypothetical protein